MGNNAHMLTNAKIRREALRQLDMVSMGCDERLPSLRSLELAALAELAASDGTSCDLADTPQTDEPQD